MRKVRVETYECNFCQRRTVSKENMAGVRVTKSGGKHFFQDVRIGHTDVHICKECTIAFYEYVSAGLKKEEKANKPAITKAKKDTNE